MSATDHLRRLDRLVPFQVTITTATPMLTGLAHQPDIRGFRGRRLAAPTIDFRYARHWRDESGLHNRGGWRTSQYDGALLAHCATRQRNRARSVGRQRRSGYAAGGKQPGTHPRSGFQWIAHRCFRHAERHGSSGANHRGPRPLAFRGSIASARNHAAEHSNHQQRWERIAAPSAPPYLAAARGFRFLRPAPDRQLGTLRFFCRSR